MFSKLSIAVFGLLCIVKSENILCPDAYSCRSGNYTCETVGPEPLCQIQCYGESSCQDSMFYCPNGCDVRCQEEQACVDSTFIFGNGDVPMKCEGDNACTDLTMYLYNDTSMKLLCEGGESCDDGIMNVYDDATFELECHGESSCDELRCVCDYVSTCEVNNGPLECSREIDNKQLHQQFKLGSLLKNVNNKMDINGFKSLTKQNKNNNKSNKQNNNKKSIKGFKNKKNKETNQNSNNLGKEPPFKFFKH